MTPKTSTTSTTSTTSARERLTFLGIAGIALLGLAGPTRAQSSLQYEARGDSHAQQGQYLLAKEFYKQALKENPHPERVWLKLEDALKTYYQVVFTGGGPQNMPSESVASSAPELDLVPAEGEPAEPQGINGWPVPGESSPSASSEVVEEPEPDQGPIVRGPSDVIYLETPIRPSDSSPVPTTQDGQPVVVSTATYEIRNITFHVDRKSTLHVRGIARNLSDRNVPNPRVYVTLYDSNFVQWATKYGSMSRTPAVLFNGRESPFDLTFPAFNRNVGAFRIDLK